MSDRLAEIRARLDAATDGPWTTDVGPLDEHGESVWFPHDTTVHGVTAYHRQRYVADAYGNEHDCELIAHAPADIEWLLAEVEARDERIALLRAEVTDIERRLRIYTEVKS
jgi:hypothetical protein